FTFVTSVVLSWLISILNSRMISFSKCALNTESSSSSLMQSYKSSKTGWSTSTFDISSSIRGSTFSSVSNSFWVNFKFRFLGVDRKSTRLNSSHVSISYAVFCLKKKKNHKKNHETVHHTIP